MAPSAQFNPAADIPSLAGKVILVTGGNTGLGKQTIAYLAAHSPTRIYLAARTASKAESAIADIQREVPSAVIEYLPLDLTSFSSIAEAASAFKSREQRLDILVNNAGIMMTPFSLTKEGYEIQFGTNHVGHALFTKLLMPVLLQTAEQPGADVRIVNVSSMGMMLAPSGGIIFNQADLEKEYTWRRYGQSKLANILFTQELSARYPQITSVAVHPGVIITDLYNAFVSGPILKGIFWFYQQLVPILPGHFKDTKGGALSQTHLATADKSTIQNGEFYRPVGIVTKGSSYSQDLGLARKLWEWTEEEFGKHGY
ncbi:oxidoreductase-like protein [Karstenula rhodostoma CBS 690.94]|uniref:Oxidoreductase-like protein n=1 Tax=Karstenula rhodostoma CBS 690.94 TaxID=1392251 RepID=A0A9P4PMV0_9PLEO|nr:oxidoreductase-like protein [Karstenula rhodostoma CBS 690.94]